MTIALAIGVVLAFVADAILKRRADNLHTVPAPPVVTVAAETSAPSTDANVVYIDTYRFRRARAARFQHESHSAS